ncbi:MAG: RNA polymerase factor sigma-54, partial [Sediminibacterium sp.]
MSLGQSLQQRQLQRLSPQQIQLMKLLQIPSSQIEQRIKEELEENPALEMNSDLLDAEMAGSADDLNDEFLQGSTEEDEAIPVDEFELSNEDLNEYNYDEDVADYKTKDDYYPELDNDVVIPIKAEVSLNELLLNQLNMLALDESSFKIAEQIIGSLEDDGYLRRALTSIADDLAFKQSMWVNEKEIERVLYQVQTFDPA